MAASMAHKLQACVVGMFMMVKVLAYTACLAFVCKFIMDTLVGGRQPNYYIISGLLYMRSSLESQLRDDWSGCSSSLSKLLLEVRLFLEASAAYVILGIFMEAGGVPHALQKMVWQGLDDVHGRPLLLPWKFSFVVTAVTDGNGTHGRWPVKWQMAEGLQVWQCARAWLSGRPWCVIFYNAPQNENSDTRWKVDGWFEMWSSRAKHIQLLLESAKEVAHTESGMRPTSATRLLQTNARSVEIVVDDVDEP
jgi:hypothetical protein